MYMAVDDMIEDSILKGSKLYSADFCFCFSNYPSGTKTCGQF